MSLSLERVKVYLMCVCVYVCVSPLVTSFSSNKQKKVKRKERGCGFKRHTFLSSTHKWVVGVRVKIPLFGKAVEFFLNIEKENGHTALWSCGRLNCVHEWYKLTNCYRIYGLG